MATRTWIAASAAAAAVAVAEEGGGDDGGGAAGGDGEYMASPTEGSKEVPKPVDGGNTGTAGEEAEAGGVDDRCDGASAVVVADVPAKEGGGDDDGGTAGGEDGANFYVPSVAVQLNGGSNDEDPPPFLLDGSDNGDNNVFDNDGPPAAKRARTAPAADAAAQQLHDETPTGPKMDVQQAVLKYKRRKGMAYHSIFDEVESSGEQPQRGAETPLGIKFALVKVKNVHSFLPYYYELATGEKYRGRPPSQSDQAVIVESILDSAPEAVKSSVRRNDVLLLYNDKLVNITDKKRLKYYRARINNNGDKPLKLTFFRPSDSAEDSDDEEELDLDPSEAVYATKYVPPETPTPSSVPKFAAAEGSKEVRAARRAVLERRLEELEALQTETSAELSELRAQDGILDWQTPKEKAGGAAGEEKTVNQLFVTNKGEEDFVIPSHIMYYPPMRIRRKELPALNEACNRVENILRQRTKIDGEADKVRGVVAQAQRRLDAKEKELAELDEKIQPALESLKYVEMEVQDGWKTMYLKLKDHYEEHGHSNVPEKEDQKLGKWITRQRTCYANAQLERPNPTVGIIKPYQYDLLNRIEFCWNPREQQFAQNVTALIEYKKEHGHTNVPLKHKDLQLANFVQKWRREYRLFREGKPSNMSEDRLKVLEEAGFTWRDPSRTRRRSDTHQETWEGFLSQLREFHAKYGHFMVNKVNKSLERGNRLGRLDEFCGWVRKQYVLYKEGSPCQLTDEKVNQLKEMDFWLERGRAHRFVANANKKEKEEAAQLGELMVPVIHNVADNGEKTEEAATTTEGGGDEAMPDATNNTTMV